MYMRVLDGVALFAVSVLKVTLDDKLRETMHPFQCEPDGVVCYTADEQKRAEDALKVAGATYSVQAITVDPTMTAKANGVVYKSRSEALDHLFNNGEVDSQRYQKLLDQLAQHTADIDDLKKHLGLPITPPASNKP